MDQQEPQERSNEAQSQLNFCMVDSPLQRGADVVLFARQPLEPGDLVCPEEMGLCLLRERDEVCQMPATHDLGFSCRIQPLERVIANRLQHSEARPPVR